MNVENKLERNIVRLKGNKINLCLFRKDEQAIKLYVKWLNDERINQYIGHNYRNDSYENVYNSFIHELPPYNYRFNIVTTDKELVIGICELKYFPQARNVILSLYIGEVEYHGKGYGTETVFLLKKFAFDELNAYRIGLSVFSDNEKAIKCYERNDFVICGIEHRADYHNGHYCDRIHMEIFKKNIDF